MRLVHSPRMGDGNDLLAEIVASKRDEVARIDAARRRALQALLATAPAPRGFAESLARDGELAVVAEIKRRSPSKGELAPDLDPARTATEYAHGGAAALSVLTDSPYFGGAPSDLEAARAATELPVLRKDFTIDPIQVVETRAYGADALLLIVAALPDDGLLRALHEAADELDLAVVVEVHDDDELDRSIDLGARIVGVNARDLSDFSEDLALGERLVQRLPPGVLRIAESAIRGPDDAQRMADAGFDAVLVGEALARATQPVELVRRLAAVRARSQPAP